MRQVIESGSTVTVTRMKSRWNNKNGNGGRCLTRSLGSLRIDSQRLLRPRYAGLTCYLPGPDWIVDRPEKLSKLTFLFESCPSRVYPSEPTFGYNPAPNVSSTSSNLLSSLSLSTRSKLHPWNVSNSHSNSLISSSFSKTLRRPRSISTRYRALNWTMSRIGSSALFSWGHPRAYTDLCVVVIYLALSTFR
jgi:hypothetical protein